MAEQLEKRLLKNGGLKAYNDEIENYVDRGVIRELSKEELESWSGGVNYISHHGVFKKSSATTKLRIVSNSSLDNNGRGVSLNSCLPKGPNSLSSLVEVFVTFRGYENVVCWDLYKAYNSVVTTPVEGHLRRMVWRFGNTSEEWKTFIFEKMAFGDRPAGCALEVAKQMIFEEGEKICPKTAKIMKRGSYVDDSNGGGDEETVELLMGKRRDVDGHYYYDGTVSKILAEGGMRPKVMVRSGETDPNVVGKLGERILGVPWRPEDDTIPFHLGLNLSPKKLGEESTVEDINNLELGEITKRMAVSGVYSIYDPIGLVSPLTIKYKILLSEISQLKLSWNDSLPPELAAKVKAVFKELVEAEDIVFPRSVKPHGAAGSPIWVGFWDGGKPAFGACIYVLYSREEAGPNGEYYFSNLLASKARVYPAKTGFRTPRSELSGLLVLCRLITATVDGAVDLPQEIICMGESECTI